MDTAIEENRKDSMKMETSIYQNGEKKYYEIVYKRTYDDKQNQVCDYFYSTTGQRMSCHLSMRSTGHRTIYLQDF